MQPKNDTSLALGVTEIVKTFISHPDHGVKASEVSQLVRDIFQAFQEGSQVSSEAIAAASAPAPQASAPETAKTEEPVATASEETAAAVAEEPAPAAPAPAVPAKAKSKSRSKARAPQVQAATTEAAAAAVETLAEAPKKSRSKAAEPAAAEEAASTPAEAVAAEEAAPEPPVDALEAKFGGRVARSPWAGMDPMDAIQHDQIVCLIDGLPRKMLHRHLKARYNMSPEEYRAWFHLPADYPMTAPGYSKEKSDYAKVVGLGTSQFTEKAKATPKTSRRSRKTSKQTGTSRQRTTA